LGKAPTFIQAIPSHNEYNIANLKTAAD